MSEFEQTFGPLTSPFYLLTGWTGGAFKSYTCTRHV